MTATYTILIDNREKQPLLFPSYLVLHGRTVRLLTRSTTLLTGDYHLEGDQTVVIERKGSLREIHGNLFHPVRRRRFTDELRRLRESVPYPVLLFEDDPHTLLTGKVLGSDLHPSAILHELIRLLLEYRVIPLFLRSDTVPHRRATAELAAMLMIEGQQQRRSLTCPPSGPPWSSPPAPPPSPSASDTPGAASSS